MEPGLWSTIQLSGADRSNSSFEEVCQKLDRNVSINEDGQHDSDCLYQHSGRDSIQRPDISDQEPMDVVPREEHPHPSSAPVLDKIGDTELRSMRDGSD